MPSELPVNILLVDDHSENLLALEAILQGLGQNLVRATSGAQALRCLLNQDFAVILLDVQMPEMDGFETATLIRQRERSRHTPIIFLTAFSTNDSMVFKGYSLGAVDYLFKPIEPEILKSKVAAFVDLFQKTAKIERQANQLAALNADLRKSEEQFRSLSACSPVGIFLTDIDSNCTYTNPRYQSILDISDEDCLGTGWLRSLRPEDRDRIFADWSAAAQQGKEYYSEFSIVTATGTVRWLTLRSSPMLSNEGTVIGYVGTVEDISDRKQAEEERAKLIREQAALKEAEATNRMKDEFLATLSHELRTPLNSILGWAKLLRNRKLDEKATARALETIERNARLQEQLIEDILDVSRIIRGKLVLNICPVNLVSVIETAVETVRLQAEAKNIAFEFAIPATEKANIAPNKENNGHFSLAKHLASPFMVSGDPDRLQQVVWNLLSNAIKFTPENGRVDITLSTDNNYAQIQVSDTGIGIQPDFLRYVFDRFRQADGSTTRSHTGLGLGLAIARHLVELHHGKIYADSPGEGQGATFTVKLPLLAAKQPQNPEKTAIVESVSSPQLPLNNVQLLVVDDDTDTRLFLSAALQQSGATVRSVSSVNEAMLAIQEYPPEILISDIGMPEEDGYTLIRKVKMLEAERGGQIPAIALTAYAREEDSTEAIAAGFHMYASKPIEPAKLINMIIKLLKVNLHSPLS
ncbi:MULTISPECIES: hybrid sensor histidine kinase/response regulator [unclassified Tolypothrix]|uniref:hybrid sensor histidine kinase/response regulator n=1 Tax=unclassified Tolypothrix TaxID=2649714 RepID=UPI0005EAC034|nr:MULTISPECIES: response regulator [unclassified Tolypothrix]BAY93056.1 PAS/PAC sensor hybrid histidine kinase [Microchaete diplosiphon NIES-3275]EKF00297.1 sensor histidine kinase [Tolypothrix sp. PCC 7601]MBE9085574.1 response regulator [Tolypothrix sp. LEGE 11397]UYD26940.1 response regulator [Tolypothrix sp. PCC 7712]UYD37201.1 response regulator [Tolypothrix sp. PCC 7601]